ncbi:MAG: 4Fe-4S cluster-binding domain-containing protein [Acidobacteriaceae bacterium]|nr:4Fe-4S cluster-binding domain-containing protein [Acidobacteriaceae bacterium]
MRNGSSSAGDSSMLLHAFLECSVVNGPGRRAVIWFQGCELNCNGCWNPNTHALRGTTLTINSVVGRILNAARAFALEGITFSGGEPIHQISSLVQLLFNLKRSAPALSAGMFSGYTARELDEGRFHTYQALNLYERCVAWTNLRAMLDFAVLGRFNKHQLSSDPLVSSRNQELRLFSDRYTRADFEAQAVEVTIDPDGLTQITGFPTLATLR